MKILLISPWMKTLYGDERAVPGHPHLGLGYLTAVLKQNSHEVKIFDQAIENDDSKLFSLIKSFKPDLIGINAFSYCTKYVSLLSQEIKKNTKIPLILGGPHVSAVRFRSLEQMPFDYAIKGEAETSLIDFLKEFKKKTPKFSTVNGLIWKNSKGEIVENSDMAYITNLDSIPFPDYSEFKFEKYAYFVSKTMPIITSRGCPYGCNYCSVRLSMGRGFRPRSPQNVIAELKHWYEQGFKKFEINDDCFSLDLNRAEKICDLIIESGLDISYDLYNGIRADRVTSNLLKKMKKSGCKFVSYGCESGDQNIIRSMGKNLKLSDVTKAVKLTKKIGIRNSVNFIIGHADETKESAEKTLLFAKSLPADFVNFYNVIPYPGTELYNWIEKNGQWIYHPDYIMKNIGSRDLKPVFETQTFTQEERIVILKKGFAIYEKSVLHFRFGKFFGEIIYYLTRNRKIFSTGLKLMLSTKIGFKIYSLLTFKSRK